MKNKKKWIVILGMGLLLILTYVVPEIVTILEDNYLQSKTRSYEIEEITLTTNEINIAERLAVFEELLKENIVIKRETEYLEISQDYEKIEQKIADFLEILNIENAPSLQIESIVSMIMMEMGENHESLYPLLKCYAVDKQKNQYIFWFDDVTKLIIAFEIPIQVVQTQDEDIYRIGENLAQYYGITILGIENILGKTSDNKNPIYWNWIFIFSNEPDGEPLVLNFYKTKNKVSFNIYPRIFMYDSTNSQTFN